jgi:hypothetical protein
VDPGIREYRISIPATLFNGGWGEAACSAQSMDVNQTFFVANLVGERLSGPARLNFKILKDASLTPIIELTANSVKIYRALWLAHGERVVPIYELKSRRPARELPEYDSNDRASVPNGTHLTDKPWEWEQLHEQQETLFATLQAAVTQVLAGPGLRLFPFRNNNCHIDTWFVVQLAFYTYAPANAPGTSVHWPEAYRRMFRVMSCISSVRLASANRDLYLRHEQRMARMAVHNRDWGETEDYQRHTELLVRLAGREAPWATSRTRADRLVGVRTFMPCTVCPDEDTHAKTVYQSNIPAGRLWWPKSDENRQIRHPETGRVIDWEDEKASAKKHKSMAAAILSHLHRDDFSQVYCHRHRDDLSAYTIRIKTGMEARLPRMLELDNGDMGVASASVPGASMYIPAPGTTFSLANGLVEHVHLTPGPTGIHYRLIAMTYYDEHHYTASVFLNDKWYRYDNAGFHTGPDQPKTSQHLLPCASFQEAATPARGFHHRSYVFSRVGGTDVTQTIQQLTEDVDWNVYSDPMYGSLAMLAGSECDESDPSEDPPATSPQHSPAPDATDATESNILAKEDERRSRAMDGSVAAETARILAEEDDRQKLAMLAGSECDESDVDPAEDPYATSPQHSPTPDTTDETEHTAQRPPEPMSLPEAIIEYERTSGEAQAQHAEGEASEEY